MIETSAKGSRLAQRLRAETREMHTQAERTGIMRPFLRGALSLEAYCALLRNLYAIYFSLEAALLRHGHLPALAAMNLPVLFRAPAIESDLDLLMPGTWRNRLPLVEATSRYLERIAALDTQEPLLLLAHAYVRYLGDLSGGQLLKKIVAPMVAERAPDAVQFYAFGASHEVQALALAFRSGLNAVALDEAQVDGIVDEALRAFVLHQALFEELDTAR